MPEPLAVSQSVGCCSRCALWRLTSCPLFLSPPLNLPKWSRSMLSSPSPLTSKLLLSWWVARRVKGSKHICCYSNSCQSQSATTTTTAEADVNDNKQYLCISILRRSLWRQKSQGSRRLFCCELIDCRPAANQMTLSGYLLTCSTNLPNEWLTERLARCLAKLFSLLCKSAPPAIEQQN